MKITLLKYNPLQKKVVKILKSNEVSFAGF